MKRLLRSLRAVALCMGLYTVQITSISGLQAATPPAMGPVTINSLLWQTDDTPKLQEIRGVITKTGSPTYLQDRSAGIELSPVTISPPLRIGDEVEITGAATPGLYSSVMHATSVRVLRARVPDPPLSVTASMAASGDYDKQLVETSGMLLSIFRSASGLTLWLQDVHQLFKAELDGSSEIHDFAILRPGSTIKITGICVMTEAQSARPVPFHILLRSPKDIEVLAGPPFWTRAHVLMLATFLVIAAAIALMFATRVERWRFELILDERTRLAYDLHDSLAQSFAGIAFQLHAIRLALKKQTANEALEKHVDLAIGMVSHSHEDARRTIAMLKPTDDTEGSLLESLRSQAVALTQGGRVELKVSTVGEPFEIPGTIKQALLRIGHEAITNAVRHASPSRISLELVYQDGGVQLAISDDGVGFVTDQKLSRGFGLHGIRSRSESNGGKLRIQSAPEQGCTVEVCFSAPGGLHSLRSLRSLRRLIW